MNSKLYLKASSNNPTSRKSKIIKLPEKQDQIHHIIISEKVKEINPKLANNDKKIITKQISFVKNNKENFKSSKLPLKNTPYFKNKLIKKSNIKEFLKENYIKEIANFLDAKSIANYMLVNKKFYKCIDEYDILWFRFYFNKFKTGKYETNRFNWKKIFLNSIQSLYKINLNSLKTKFLGKYKKNLYCAKKNPYFISNNLFAFLKPKYQMIIDGIEYPVKLVFKNEILSHINFFANFDSEYINLNKIKKIVLTLSETNLGLINKIIYTYEMKKNSLQKLEELGVKSKICKIYSFKEFILSTFEENLIFFVNISLPICKICEIFDFLNGIHGKNLDYFDDNDKNFGLFDYSLLINIKNNSELFFNININTLDLKNESHDDIYYHYQNTNQIVSNSLPQFNLRTIAMQEKLTNFLLIDLLLLNDKGDHMICDSHPLIFNKIERLEFDNSDYDNNSANVLTENYEIQLNFKYLHKESLYIFDNFNMKIKKDFVKGIYKMK